MIYDLLNICGEQWFDNGWLSPIVADANLPVRLLSFDAQLKQQNVLLTLLVNGEEQLSHYELERNTDGLNFSFLHRQPARNIAGEHRYDFSDSKFPQNKVL